MHYYQVRIKALSAGRYLNAPFRTDWGPWVRNQSGVPAELQSYHLRKIYEKRFILETGGSWVGLEIGSDKVTKYLNMRFKSAGKEQAFEITPQPYHLDRVRIKSLANELFVQLPKAKGKDSVMADAAESTPNAKKWNEWGNDDPTIFLLTIVRATIPNDRTIKAIEGAAQKLKEHPPRLPTPPTPPVPQKTDIIPSSPFPKDLSNRGFLHYYQVRIKVLSTGRYLNVQSNTASDPWVRSQNAVPAELQTYHLRKIYLKMFILEICGLWVGLEIGDYQGTKFLSVGFKSAGKEQAFEITPQPYLSDRVRIKSLANEVFAQHPKGYSEYHGIPVNFTPTARLVDDGVFVIEPAEYKFEITDQENNSNQGTVVSVPAVLDSIRPLDGTKVQFQSVYLKQYLCAENGGGTLVAANRDMPEDKNWETFELWAIPDTQKCLLQVSGGKFMGLDGERLVALSDTPGKVETFEIVQKDDDFTRVRIKAWDDKFLQAKKDSVTADAAELTPEREIWNEWSDYDPTIFLLTIVRATIPNSRTIKAIAGAAQKLKEHSPRPPTPPTPSVPQNPDIILPKDLSNGGFLDGVRLQFKSVIQHIKLLLTFGTRIFMWIKNLAPVGQLL